MEELIQRFCEEMELDYEKSYGNEGFSFLIDLEINKGSYWTFVIVSEENKTVSLVIKGPISFPEDRRVDIAEYLTRANFHNFEGALKMNFGDGTVFYHHVLRYNPNADIRHIKYQLYAGFDLGRREMETHFSGILSIIHEDLTPAEAVKRAELKSNFRQN